MLQYVLGRGCTHHDQTPISYAPVGGYTQPTYGGQSPLGQSALLAQPGLGQSTAMGRSMYGQPLAQTYGQPAVQPVNVSSFEQPALYGGYGQPALSSGLTTYGQGGQPPQVAPGLAQTSLLGAGNLYGQPIGYSTATMGNYNPYLNTSQVQTGALYLASFNA